MPDEYFGWAGDQPSLADKAWATGSPAIYAIEPLYAAPPRPDASAELIEAACLLDKHADEFVDVNERIEQGYRMAAKYLRARAAERSEK